MSVRNNQGKFDAHIFHFMLFSSMFSWFHLLRALNVDRVFNAEEIGYGLI